MESFLGIVGKLGMVLEFLWFFEIFWVDHIWSCPWHAPKVARVFYLLPAPLSAKKLLVVIQNGVHTSHIDQRPTPLDDLNGTSNQKCQKIGQELDSLNQKTLIEPNGNGKLTGWWLSPTPPKNMKSVGIMKFLNGKIKTMFQTKKWQWETYCITFGRRNSRNSIQTDWDPRLSIHSASTGPSNITQWWSWGGGSTTVSRIVLNVYMKPCTYV